MAVLLKADEARKLVSGSQERQNELIRLMNEIIHDQSHRGKRWAHLPLDISLEDGEFLYKTLHQNGYMVDTTKVPAINW